MTSIIRQTNLAQMIDLAADRARYDECAKKLLTYKAVIAWILKSCTKEFSQYSVNFICDNCLKENIEISSRAVHQDHPDRSKLLDGNEQIDCLNSEANAIKDQTVYYDIRFKAYIPNTEEPVQLTFKFVLYKGEVSRFGIRIGEEIPPETEEKIRTEVLLKRAKLRAMHLLEDMDRTESALREKLRQGLYPSDVTEAAIEYVKSFGYLDDVRYAENFVRSRQNVKSKKEIGTALLQKGISSEIAKRAMEICYEEMGEEEAIRKILRKKKFDPNKAEEAQMQKIYGYLGRKGFRYDTVRQVIQNYNDDA